MDEITALAVRVSSVPTKADLEEVLSVMNDVERLQQRAKEVKQQLEQALIEYIDQHGEFESGDKRWYAGTEKTYKPALPLPRLVEMLMNATEGDFDRFCALLSSGAFKPGACREVLGPEFATAFEAVVKRDLQTGKPKRAVKVADKRFSK